MKTELVYSPDDGGWYVEIWDRNTGITLHVTRVFKDRHAARRAADKWIEKTLEGN